MKLCECGCGQPAPIATKHDPKMGYVKGEPRRFVRGHNGSRSGYRKPDVTSIWTGYARAKNAVDRTRCEVEHIGGCKGRIEVHHIDKNPLNNSRKNLAVLCRAHHILAENGRIDLGNPVMPAFYVDTAGNRRYAHTLEKQQRERQKMQFV